MSGNYGEAASWRLEQACYAGPRERTDVCAKCMHSAPYPSGRPGVLKCRRNGTFVASGGICDDHALRTISTATTPAWTRLRP
jgi:hypothetical protein